MRNKVPKKKTGNIIKSYKCNQCDYASSRMEHLRTHLKTHSGEKPNKCSQCEYASSSAFNLGMQLKRQSGEKSNKCNQCEYASSRLRRWYITIPSSNQWCTTIKNHRYQWLSYPKTIGKPLISMVALNHSIQCENRV